MNALIVDDAARLVRASSRAEQKALAFLDDAIGSSRHLVAYLRDLLTTEIDPEKRWRLYCEIFDTGAHLSELEQLRHALTGFTLDDLLGDPHARSEESASAATGVCD